MLRLARHNVLFMLETLLTHASCLRRDHHKCMHLAYLILIHKLKCNLRYSKIFRCSIEGSRVKALHIGEQSKWLKSTEQGKVLANHQDPCMKILPRWVPAYAKQVSSCLDRQSRSHRPSMVTTTLRSPSPSRALIVLPIMSNNELCS